MATRSSAPALAALIVGVGWIVGCVGGCFNAPSAAVMFACGQDEEASCPGGYTCEADGCCHREGSDVAAHLGECKLGGAATEAQTTGAASGGVTTGVGSTTTSGGTSTSTGGTGTGGTGTGETTGDATSTGGTSTGGTSTGGTGTTG